MDNVISMAETRFEDSCKNLENALTSIQRNFIEAGIATVAIKESCGTVQGGSEFPAVMMERFGLGSAASNELLAIGLNAKRLLAIASSLPRESRSTLYKIARMDDATIADKIARGVITPTASRDQVMEVLCVGKRKMVKKTEVEEVKVKPVTLEHDEDDAFFLIERGSISWEEVADLSGISTPELAKAEKDYTHPQFMVASRLRANRERLQEELAPLAKPERRRVMKAVMGIVTHEQEVFNAAAKAALPKYNKDLEASLKAELGKQREMTSEFKKRLSEPFDKSDFKFIRGVLHSDREVTTERKEQAFNLFMKLAPLYE